MFKNYSDLIDRTIIYNPHRTKRIISYGVIAICSIDESVLIIQRKYSPDFINFIKGWYRKSQLISLFREMTEDELLSIKKIMYKPERFIALYNNISPDGDATYATLRFEDNQQKVWEMCNNTSYGRPETEWLFPKGKQETSRETHVECAKREFLEETGLTYMPENSISDSPITFYNNSSIGFTYETKLWVFVFKDKPLLPVDVDNFEIKTKRWVKRSEINKYFDSTKLSIVDEAFRIYRRVL